MSDLKITVDQLKNYLCTGLILKTDFKTINKNEVKNPFFTLDGIDLHNQFKIWTYDDNFCKHIECVGKGFTISQIRPVCFKLSDLDKEIEVNGERFVPIIKMLELATTQIWGEPIEMTFTPEILTNGESTGIIAYNDTERVSFTVDFDGRRKDFALYMDGSEMMLDKLFLFQKLFEWHFWPFGDEYFEQGLVIDKRKITENNSKNT